MKRWPCLAVLLALGCERPSVAPEGVLVVSQEQQASWIRNFNPLLPQGVARFPSQGGIYEPLMIFNAISGEFVPWLATSHRWSEDRLTLSFELREGVFWSDGRPFRADDVAFTFELLKKFPALDQQSVWSLVSAVRAVGERQIEMTMQRPFVPGLIFIAQQAIVPRHIWEKIEDPVTFSNPNPVATGPYTEVELFQTQMFQLGRNPRYWQPGKPAVKSLRFPAYPGNDQATLALIHGEVDWGGNFIPAIDRIFVGRDPAHHRYWFPLVNGVVALYPNTTRAPFDDVRVRKAISLALDRELTVKVAMYGYSKPADATALSEANARWKDAATIAAGDWVKQDLGRAQKLLDEAGLKRGADGVRLKADGTPMIYELNVVTGWSDWVRAAQVMSRSLAEIGIQVTVRPHDFGSWFERLQRGNYDLSLGWTTEGPTPHRLYRGLMSRQTVPPAGEPAAVNWARFGSEKADGLLAELEATDDPARQLELSRGLQEEFSAQAPVIPVFFNPAWGAFNQKRFEGFPDQAHPYARLSPNHMPECLLVLTAVRPKGT
jgi:peptide/nickel transport system substrate-binding protein